MKRIPHFLQEKVIQRHMALLLIALLLSTVVYFFYQSFGAVVLSITILILVHTAIGLLVYKIGGNLLGKWFRKIHGISETGAE